jgi:zinc ribbon protein
MNCPRCGAQLMDGMKFCNNCGNAIGSGSQMATTVPAAGYGAATTVPAAAYATAPAALPKAHREGDRLIVPKANPALPAFCIKCGQPSTTQLHRKITWMNPAIYLLCLFGLIGIIIAVILQATIGKKIELYVPLCDAHAAARKRTIWIGVALTFLVPVVLPILGALTNDNAVIAISVILALLTFITGIVVWAMAYTGIRTKKVDDVQGEFFASPQFLEKLG